MSATSQTPRTRAEDLPQLRGRPLVTDGGLETDLIFHHGVDLPDFAAFPLVDTAEGRALLEAYYDGYAAVAAAAGAGLVLESATWRANPDWGDRLGWSATDLARVNRDAIGHLAGLAGRYADSVAEVVLGGSVGPRGDGYRPGADVDAEEARAYHRPQVEALAAGGADVVTAYTLTDPGEAVGVVLAAREVGIPVAISFTVETDGRLPGGTSVADAVATVDAAARPDYYLLNCAHPSHVEAGLDDGPWRERVLGLRPNSSTLSHAELDEAEELDEGDLSELTAATDRLRPHLPNLSIVGGCCGTDARHVGALWGVAPSR